MDEVAGLEHRRGNCCCQLEKVTVEKERWARRSTARAETESMESEAMLSGDQNKVATERAEV